MAWLPKQLALASALTLKREIKPVFSHVHKSLQQLYSGDR